MRIIWDERKRLANIDKHGLDFADLDANFFLYAVIRPARANRFMAIGQLNDGLLTIIFARLGIEGLSIISMRPAHRNERVFLNGKEN
jgi:uncharacterized protein